MTATTTNRSADPEGMSNIRTIKTADLRGRLTQWESALAANPQARGLEVVIANAKNELARRDGTRTCQHYGCGPTICGLTIGQYAW